MSTFEVKVVRIRNIEPIENADVIELAVVDDYRSVVQKGIFKAGDLAVYIPEAAVLPDDLIQAMGLEGKLAGKQKNRVKAVRLRGCLSQGLLYFVDPGEDIGSPFITIPTPDGVGTLFVVKEEQDVTEELGIVKYEPPIPTYMSGEIYNAGTDITVSYDVENIKRYPDIIQPDEEVVMTEKIHGTFCGIGILPSRDWSNKHYKDKFVVFSKGYGAQGLCFSDSEVNEGNVYFRALHAANVFMKLDKFVTVLHEHGLNASTPLFLLGEVYGRGIQDLTYGAKEVDFRVFDIAIGYRNEQRYADYKTFSNWSSLIEVDTVPVLYRGPFSQEVLVEHTNGKESVSGNTSNIREGVVIRPVQERRNDEIGRVILKSVSEDYLLRKGGTEYN